MKRFPAFRAAALMAGLVIISAASPAAPRAASLNKSQKIPEIWRNVETGWIIPDESYADQPYLVKCDDGSWLCVITTAAGHEGDNSQHIVATRSTDFGRTWSDLIMIEPPGPPEASYATLLKTDWGRIYVFYNYNGDKLTEVKRISGGTTRRVDTLGHFVFKYSDDHGKTWSKERYRIPVRETEIDRQNIYGGAVQFFWHVGRPLIHEGAAYVTLHKVGNFDQQFIAKSEGFFLRSDNILQERDPARIRWELLPEGDVGLRAPDGPIAEEHSIVALSDGTLFTTYRTNQDWPAHAYSRDGGRTWTAPEYMTYGPGQRRVKHARAANFVWRASNGRYLYWFHNHGGHTYQNQRNPAWVLGGREVDTPEGKVIQWSEPEILFYHDDHRARMSYPDFLEEDGRYFLTQTEKQIARIHEVPAEFFEMLWRQHEMRSLVRDSLLVDLSDKPLAPGTTVARPELPSFQTQKGTRLRPSKRLVEGGGLTFDFWVKFDSLRGGQMLVDSRDKIGNGFAIYTTDRGTIEISLRGPLGEQLDDFGLAQASWDCDPGRLETGKWHHVAIVLDGGPKIIAFIIDGVFHDGGLDRQFGWARYPYELRSVGFGDTITFAPRLEGQMHDFRLYGRALRTSEVLGNWRATGGDGRK